MSSTRQGDWANTEQGVDLSTLRAAHELDITAVDGHPGRHHVV
jgi:hypothetical protein